LPLILPDIRDFVVGLRFETKESREGDTGTREQRKGLYFVGIVCRRLNLSITETKSAYASSKRESDLENMVRRRISVSITVSKSASASLREVRAVVGPNTTPVVGILPIHHQLVLVFSDYVHSDIYMILVFFLGEI